MPARRWPEASVPAFLARLADSAAGELFIVTGGREAGKTSFCLELARQASARGIAVAGLVSPAEFEGRKKKGIDLLNLATHERRRLAVRWQRSVNEPVSSRWLFDTSVLEWGNAILRSIEEEQLVILDELGPLEISKRRGLAQGLELVGARSYALASVVIRPSLLAKAKNLWPWAEVFTVTGGKP